MTNHKFYFYLQYHIKLLLYVGIRTNAFFFSKYFRLKNRFTVAELRIEIPSLLGCKYTLFLVIYVHDRKHERKKLTFTLLAVIPSLCTSSSSSSFSKYGRRLNARSSSQTSIGEKVVRCRFFVAECSVGVEVWSGSLSQSLLELVMSE